MTFYFTVKLSSPIISPVNVGDREITLKMKLELDTMLSLVLIKTITYQVFYKSEYFSKTVGVRGICSYYVVNCILLIRIYLVFLFAIKLASNRNK